MAPTSASEMYCNDAATIPNPFHVIMATMMAGSVRLPAVMAMMRRRVMGLWMNAMMLMMNVTDSAMMAKSPVHAIAGA